MIVFDLQGNSHDMPSVDARECVQVMGWTYEPATAPEVDAVIDQFHEMTNAELKGWLDEHNIPYTNPINKAALLALCRG